MAEVFGKRHDNVLKDIETLVNQSPENLGDYFFQTTYTDSRNRTYKKYNLTKDGFTLLVMGFNGKKALQFKLMYINEFNRMEQKLKKAAYSPVTQPALPTNFKEALIALVHAEEEKEQLLLENKEKQVVIEAQKPKVTTYNSIYKGGTEFTAFKDRHHLIFGYFVTKSLVMPTIFKNHDTEKRNFRQLTLI
ncbi:Rha family transcriptional regulator [Bacillus manliponensis]|uniref:Rha family transcriptional regulator n=1 Tax=Bacillus manliponensis TaxID=574376 RepID=UPI0035180A1B